MITKQFDFNLSKFVENERATVIKQDNIRVNRRKGDHPHITLRNINRRSYAAKKHFFTPKRRKRDLRKIALNKVRAKLKRKWKKMRYGKVVIRIKRKNSFLTLYSFNKKKKRNFIRFKCSVGALKIQGRDRKAWLTKTKLGEWFAKRITAKNYRIIDIHFIKKHGKFYRLIVNGLTKRHSLVIRLFKIKHQGGHGSIRPKKAPRN